jgi:hypothetical protein
MAMMASATVMISVSPDGGKQLRDLFRLLQSRLPEFADDCFQPDGVDHPGGR